MTTKEALFRLIEDDQKKFDWKCNRKFCPAQAMNQKVSSHPLSSKGYPASIWKVILIIRTKQILQTRD